MRLCAYGSNVKSIAPRSDFRSRQPDLFSDKKLSMTYETVHLSKGFVVLEGHLPKQRVKVKLPDGPGVILAPVFCCYGGSKCEDLAMGPCRSPLTPESKFDVGRRNKPRDKRSL